MQSIIDKLQTPQSFGQSVQVTTFPRFDIELNSTTANYALQRTADPRNFHFKFKFNTNQVKLSLESITNWIQIVQIQITKWKIYQMKIDWMINEIEQKLNRNEVKIQY